MKNQNFNIGDKLLCKIDVNKSYLTLTKGVEYIILSADFDVLLSADIDVLYYKYNIIDDTNKDFYYIEEFDDYFYTKNEVRKIKLEKLKNEEAEY